jgi:hypothetical protein
MGSIVSGMMGGGSSPGQEAQMQAVKQGGQDYQNYRPQAMQARLNMLGSAMLPFQGANNMLETLWGDPNQKPARKPLTWGGHQPATPMGQQAQQMQSQPQKGYGDDPASNFLDPLGIFAPGGLVGGLF